MAALSRSVVVQLKIAATNWVQEQQQFWLSEALYTPTIEAIKKVKTWYPTPGNAGLYRKTKDLLELLADRIEASDLTPEAIIEDNLEDFTIVLKNIIVITALTPDELTNERRLPNALRADELTNERCLPNAFRGIMQTDEGGSWYDDMLTELDYLLSGNSHHATILWTSPIVDIKEPHRWQLPYNELLIRCQSQEALIQGKDEELQAKDEEIRTKDEELMNQSRSIENLQSQLRESNYKLNRLRKLCRGLPEQIAKQLNGILRRARSDSHLE